MFPKYVYRCWSNLGKLLHSYSLICRTATKVQARQYQHWLFFYCLFTLLKHCCNLMWNNIINIIKSCLQIISCNFDSIVRLCMMHDVIMTWLVLEWNDVLTGSISSVAINSINFSLVLFDRNEISFADNSVSMIILLKRLLLSILWSRVADFILFSYDRSKAKYTSATSVLFWRHNLWPHL